MVIFMSALSRSLGLPDRPWQRRINGLFVCSANLSSHSRVATKSFASENKSLAREQNRFGTGGDSLGQVEEVALEKSSSFSESLTYTLAPLDLSGEPIFVRLLTDDFCFSLFVDRR